MDPADLAPVLEAVAAAAVATEFGDEAARTAIVKVAAVSPAFLFVRGLPDGTGIGAVVFFQGFAFTAVTFPSVAGSASTGTDGSGFCAAAPEIVRDLSETWPRGR